MLKDFGIKPTECVIEMNYAKTIPNVINVSKTIQFLKKKYETTNKNTIQNLTFSQFAKNILGEQTYKDFTISAGYTDYENEDIYEVLYHYGMEDNSPNWVSLIVPWKELVLKLCGKIGTSNIKFKHNVTNIIPTSCGFRVVTENNIYNTDKVIVATNINSIRKLVPGANEKNSIYYGISGQPFLRVYGKFDKKSAEIMQQFVPTQTIVPGPLHKIIPFGNGIFMIAYTDNEGALILKNHLENTEKNIKLFENLLEFSLGIPHNSIHLTFIKGYYWPVGTHYYKPMSDTNFYNRKAFINAIQHPLPNMLVVGEAVSRNQGWTEGALESVHAVLTKQWITEDTGDIDCKNY